jgi:hypothetical protein
MIDDSAAGRTTDGRPPTFTSWLRNLSDPELASLFAVRPDLVTPVPADFGALAARATTRPSALRALDRLDLFGLQVLEGCVALGDDRLATPPGVTPDRLASALAAPADRFADALETLLGAALVWRDGPRLRPVAVLRDILTRPAGLGPPLRALLAGRPAERLDRLAADLGLPTGYSTGDPAGRIAAELSRPERLDALLAEAGDAARPVLDRLVWGPPDGTVSGAGRDVDVATAASPIDRLLARGLLVATGDSTVTLPLEVALHLRGGRAGVHRDPLRRGTAGAVVGGPARRPPQRRPRRPRPPARRPRPRHGRGHRGAAHRDRARRRADRRRRRHLRGVAAHPRLRPVAGGAPRGAVAAARRGVAALAPGGRAQRVQGRARPRPQRPR